MRRRVDKQAVQPANDGLSMRGMNHYALQPCQPPELTSNCPSSASATRSFPPTASMANAVEPRSVASLPQRAGTIKAPAIAPFETADEIALALANRDPGLLTAGKHLPALSGASQRSICALIAILQIDKRTNALVIEGSKTDSKDAVALYLVRFPAADGVYSAWDFAHKVCCLVTVAQLEQACSLRRTFPLADQQFAAVGRSLVVPHVARALRLFGPFR